jgi:hypothetical protein
MKREVSKLDFSEMYLTSLQTHDYKKREEKSSGFGLIQLRTVYNFCTINQPVARFESVGIKLQETISFQCRTENIGVLLRRWSGANIIFIGKRLS